ncbi:NEDD8-activating enzyme E1 catalytic subunit [Echria macrotheca]|uniref:NEDD8-activating enzyme E1 catalytic subunit n=1 Tax=Echria macrotheca TaxID=438768 RepID=A0AAJ0FBH4_9PEZI|nr:NEDD8-activating enzyme E1 catalytic subunit [Echria macrotheca]
MASAEAYPGSEPARWKYLDQIRTRAGPFTDPDTFYGSKVASEMDRMNVLVIGAGGLGCEILKNLALSGFKNIHVIDMDTIDISNLNRQFLFRQADVGKYKAEVAAAFVMRRVKGVHITAHNKMIQDFDEDFYMKFQLVVCGLDSIEARRWINATLVNMVDEDIEDSVKPLIDGGTEGFKGQARVIIPTITSCIECQLDMHAPRAAVPLCTLASIPRQPEHCIEWAHVIAWDEEKPFPKLDKDDPEHITWLYQKALLRAREFNIPGVTYSLTQGVVKNIIPAIAATNSVIAAACCNEALKISSSCAPALGYPADNYMMYSGNDSVYTYTFRHEKKDDCPVCGNLARDLVVDPSGTLRDLVDSLAVRPEAQLKKPSLRAQNKTLYMQSPASLEEQTRPNLDRTLVELGLGDGDEVAVTDPAFATVSFKFRLVFRKAAS